VEVRLRAVEQFVRYDRPVIPVLLRDADEPLEMPGFLQAITWIDLRRRSQTARLVEAVRDAARI
jgi:hypothetical protein